MSQNEEQKTKEDILTKGDILKLLDYDSAKLNNTVKQKLIEKYYQYKRELINQENNQKSCKELFCKNITIICIVVVVMLIIACSIFYNISTKYVQSKNNITKSIKSFHSK